MILTNTWSYTPNQLASDATTATNIGKSFGLALINALIAGGWTCVQSSNGAGSLSSSNQITSISNIIGAASGTNHTWILLKSPVGYMLGADNSSLGDQSCGYLVLSWLTTTYTSMSMTVHRELPTGGTASVNPSSPNQTSVISSQQISRTTVANVPRFHFGVDTHGHFWAAVSYETTNIFTTLIISVPLADQTLITTLSKLYPYDIGVGYIYSDVATTPLQSTLNSSGFFSGFTYTGATTATISGISMAIGANQAGGDFNGNVPYTDWYAECQQVGARGKIGRVVDIYVTAATVTANGSTVIGSPQTHVCFGGIAVPCNVPLLA